MDKSVLDSYLDDTEKVAIQMFVDNEVQLKAVKKVLLFDLYNNGVLKKGEEPKPLRNSFVGIVRSYDDPKKIGQMAMALVEGINILEVGFKQLQSYSKGKPKVGKDKGNPAV